MTGMMICGTNTQLDKQKHAFATLCYLYGHEELSETDWRSALDKMITIQQYICDQVYITRKKDYDNPFRHTTFRNKAEMKATIGSIDDNSFITAGESRRPEEMKNFVEEIREGR